MTRYIARPPATAPIEFPDFLHPAEAGEPRPACAGYPGELPDDPELWWPRRRPPGRPSKVPVATADTPRTNRAKELCASCPVRTPCLAHALRYDEQGIWGGYEEHERAALLAKHREERRGRVS